MREGGGIDLDRLLPPVDQDRDPAVRDRRDGAEPRTRKPELRRGPREQDPVACPDPDLRVLPPDARAAAGAAHPALPRDCDLDRCGVVDDPPGDRHGAERLVEPVDVVVGVGKRDPARVLRSLPVRPGQGGDGIGEDLRLQPHRAAGYEMVKAGVDPVRAARQRRDGRAVALVPLP